MFVRKDIAIVTS